MKLERIKFRPKLESDCGSWKVFDYFGNNQYKLESSIDIGKIMLHFPKSVITFQVQGIFSTRAKFYNFKKRFQSQKNLSKLKLSNFSFFPITRIP